MPVEGVSPLAEGATVGDLGAKLDAQTANLDRANGRTSDVLQIMDACDRRNQGIIREMTKKPWWKVWG